MGLLRKSCSKLFKNQTETKLTLIISDVPASGMYFLTYEYIQDKAKERAGPDAKVGLLSTIFAGGMAGIANWAVGMPADVLKSRLQTGKFSFYSLQKHSLIIFKLILQQHRKECTKTVSVMFSKN